MLILPQYRVPVELWRHIFLFATTIPNRDEFSRDGLTFGMLPYDNEEMSSKLTTGELTGLIQARYTIIRVCKHWYDVGIQVRWSHLRIRLRNWDYEVTRIGQALESKPILASYIIRLTVQGEVRPVYEPYNYQDDRNVGLFSKSVSQSGLISKFTNLRIISCPFGPMTTKFPPRVTCLMIGSIPLTNPKFIPEPGMLSNWAGLQTLILDDRKAVLAIPLGQPRDIVLPKLMNLRTHILRSDTARHISKHWYLPALRALSLFNCIGDSWISLIQRCRKTIRHLDLGPWIDMRDSSQALEMPTLSSLALINHSCEPWINFIRSDSVQEAAIFCIDFIDNFTSRPTSTLQSARALRSAYPSLNTLLLYEKGQFQSPQTRYGLTLEDLQSLETGGVLVKVRRDVRADDDSAVHPQNPFDTLEYITRCHPNLSLKNRELALQFLFNETGSLRIRIDRIDSRNAGPRNQKAVEIIERIRADVF